MNVGTICVCFCALWNDFHGSAEIGYCSRKIAGFLTSETTFEIGRSVIGCELQRDTIGLDRSMEVACACPLIAEFDVRYGFSFTRLSCKKLRRRSDKTCKANTEEDRL